ncbi:MAG: formylglycine-generating enzyme family protein [Woeseiaceae bacterium]
MKCLVLIVGALISTLSYSQESADPDTASIHGGTFRMGTEASDIPGLKSRFAVDFPGVFENEVPGREVTISSFRIDRYEVTNARFFGFLAADPEWRQDQLQDHQHNGQYLAHWENGRYPEGAANLPVVNVTWSAAQSYCRWRGGRLPTEAEWEYVARAGDSREFPWGDELPSPERANYSASSHGKAIEVGTYPPNDFGVFDLAGNVWEFLYDAWEPRFADDPRSDPVAGGLLTPQEEATVTGRRAVRGASFGGSVVNVRTRWRDSHVATNAIEFVGFRCAYPGPD